MTRNRWTNHYKHEGPVEETDEKQYTLRTSLNPVKKTCVFTTTPEAELVCIGIISYQDEASSTTNWNVLTSSIKNQFDLSTQLFTIPENEHFVATSILCKAAAQENGLTIVYGPEGGQVSYMIESASNYLGIPYISTDWASTAQKQLDNTFNLYPDATLLAQAYGTIVQSLDWKTFAIIYENEESLVRLQEVIKLQKYQTNSLKNTVLLYKLDESGDSRYIFKKIRSTPIYSIVLDCGIEKIVDVLLQAKDVKLLDDLGTNIFLTSLDAHTLDLTILDTKSNITTVRLFDPFSLKVLQHTRKYYPDVKPSELNVKTALMHDAMLLLAESLNAIKSTHADGEIVYEPLFCSAPEKHNDKYGLVSALQEATIEGITGEISLKNGKRESFEITAIELSQQERPIGIWNSDNPTKIYLTRNATEREAELQKRLQSHNFIVTSRIGEPYLYESKDPDATGNARFYGYSMDLITEIAKILNITFEFQITKDNAPPNLQVDLIERRADLAICDYTITPQRREVIDFSMPFMTLGIGILHKKPKVDEETNMYGFLGPLSTVVWMHIGLLYLFMSFILVFIARLSTEDWENPHPCDQNPSELENIWGLKNCCWLTLGSICTQGCDLLPKGGCTRVATASWWFFSLIITSSYTANLAAFLTMSKKDDSITSVEELATQSKVKYGCLYTGSTASFFQYSNNSLYQRMWNTMINEKPSVFEDANKKGMKRVQSTKNGLYAFFMESTGIEFEMERNCDLRRIGDLLDSKSYGIGMPFNAEYRHSINAAVLKLQETGKLGELKEKWWKLEREGEPCPSDVPISTDALALTNVGGVFIVLGAGIGIAFFIALLEFLWNVHNVAVEQHISYLEALKIEATFACNIFVTEKRVKPLLDSETTSAKSDDNKSNKGIIVGAGSFLHVNSSIINRICSSPNNHDKESNNNSNSKRSCS